jgi:hypothetical protein
MCLSTVKKPTDYSANVCYLELRAYVPPEFTDARCYDFGVAELQKLSKKERIQYYKGKKRYRIIGFKCLTDKAEVA